MEIKVEIETHDTKLLSDLFKFEENEWKEKSFNGDASAKYEGSIERLTEGLPEIIVISLNILRDVVIGVVAAWLYDKIRGRAVSLKIEKTEVEMDRGAVKKIITEKFEESR